VAGFAADTFPFQVLAARSGTGRAIVVTNDSVSAQSFTLKAAGLPYASVNVTISTPPAGVAELNVSGLPGPADAAMLQTLLVSPGKDTRSALTVTSGSVNPSISIVNALA